MGNEENLKILKQGVKVWNQWRANSKAPMANLSDADLSGAELAGANFKRTSLNGVDLSGANLDGADFTAASLVKADLSAATLHLAVFQECNLRDANFRDANLAGTIFADVDLTDVIGLDSCQYAHPCIVDHQTITQSKGVPIVFWRGCGLPDVLIGSIASLTSDAIEFHSCFITYSSKDQDFAKQLHADLQDIGVRCWFAPHDPPIGKRGLDGLDVAFGLRDKVILILSEAAIAGDWLEDEVTLLVEEERQRKKEVLIPVRLDDAVIETCKPWANNLRARNVGDFTRWKEHDAYTVAFERVVSELKADH